MTMAKIGATPKGGVCRLALTDLDKQGRDLIVSWAKEAGCTVTVDQMGNVFMRRAGRNQKALPVMTGSHADSQPTGGRFDGIYGVLGGLEVIRSLDDHDIETEHPVEVVICTNKEGSRFAPAMVASGVFAGVLPWTTGCRARTWTARRRNCRGARRWSCCRSDQEWLAPAPEPSGRKVELRRRCHALHQSWAA